MLFNSRALFTVQINNRQEWRKEKQIIKTVSVKAVTGRRRIVIGVVIFTDISNYSMRLLYKLKGVIPRSLLVLGS